MNTAGIVDLVFAVGAGNIAAFLASGPGNNAPGTEAAAQLKTESIRVPKTGIGLGRAVVLEDLQRQGWPIARLDDSLLRRHQGLATPTNAAGSTTRPASQIDRKPCGDPIIAVRNGVANSMTRAGPKGPLT